MLDPTPVSPPEPARRLRRPTATTAMIVVAVLAAVVAAVVLGTGGGEEPAAGPDLAVPLVTADGSTTTLDQLSGRPMVVNFFASWCPPCRAELPDLERVHQQVGADVRFVGVNVDYDVSTWKSFVGQSQITYETVFEPRQDLLRAVGGTGMPTTALVSADGTVLYVHTGLLDDDRLLALLDEHGLR